MEKRFVLFLVLSFGILVGYQHLMTALFPPKPRPPVARKADGGEAKPGEQDADGAKGEKKAAAKPDEKPAPKAPAPKPEKPEAKEKPAEKAPKVEAPPVVPEQCVTLGSADPKSPYRMVVTLTNRGAAVGAVELNNARYQDLTDEHGMYYDRSGYLGRVSLDETWDGPGCRVQVVAPGTPAESAGLKVGDLITSVEGVPVSGGRGLRAALERTRPRQTVTLSVRRGGQDVEIPATLGDRPLAVIRPEGADPLSFLLTLAQVGDQALGSSPPRSEDKGQAPAGLEAELAGVRLRNGTWEVDRATQSEVVFRFRLPQWGLEVTKTYALEEVPADAAHDPSYKAYHLVFKVEVHNVGAEARQVAYQLDGPTGLPIEGWWYAAKVSRTWSGVGVRDVAVLNTVNKEPLLIGAAKIADGAVDALPWKEAPLDFIGVDAQYFSAVLIPQKESRDELWFAESWPMNVGQVDPQRKNLADVTFRLVSTPHALNPGEALRQEFVIFAGPKRPALLAGYGLQDLVYYGWFGWFARPLVAILHFFYSVVGNYGIAVIMLTVAVRLCMFPLSRKQTLNALKMQELQPEIKKIQEKYKKDQEAKIRAQQELFRKHNYNPLGGCLVIFIQLPIFVALYRSLMVDVELRQAPLLSEAIRWCSNLSAPDMFLDWSRFMPAFITKGIGFFGLGPYFNVLPILTIALFLWQQKKLMPPPADEQAAMQQKVMTYMMIFMGLLFFKVASGLCIYFIASSLWGLGERRFLPKAKPAEEQTSGPAGRAAPLPPASSNGDGRAAAKKRKRSRGKR